jgi:hypothetical protein
MEEEADHKIDGRSTRDLNIVERMLFGRPKHRWEVNNKMILKKEDGGAWNGLI